MRDLLIVDPAYQPRFTASGLISAAAVVQYLGGHGAVRKGVAVTPATLRFQDGTPEKVFFKQYHYPSPAWTFVGRRSKARREFENYAVFQQFGIPCAQPLACGELRDRLGRLRRAFILTRAIPKAQTLIEFVQAHCPARAAAAARQLRRDLIARLAPQVARIHEASFFHNDLVWRNILVTCPSKGSPELWWIDCPRGRFARMRQHRLRLKDLAALDKVAARRCSRAERLAFLKAYLAQSRLDAKAKRLARQVLAYKHRRWTDER
jgi:tRNA A-37 threonylcarbamoyl transferase component Bud32